MRGRGLTVGNLIFNSVKRMCDTGLSYQFEFKVAFGVFLEIFNLSHLLYSLKNYLSEANSLSYKRAVCCNCK